MKPINIDNLEKIIKNQNNNELLEEIRKRREERREEKKAKKAQNQQNKQQLRAEKLAKLKHILELSQLRSQNETESVQKYKQFLALYDPSKIGTMEEIKKDGSTSTIIHTKFGPLIMTQQKTPTQTTLNLGSTMFGKFSHITSYEGFFPTQNEKGVPILQYANISQHYFAGRGQWGKDNFEGDSYFFTGVVKGKGRGVHLIGEDLYKGNGAYPQNKPQDESIFDTFKKMFEKEKTAIMQAATKKVVKDEPMGPTNE